MFDRFGTTLLDVDMDFMCADNYGWDEGRHTQDMEVAVSGRDLGRALRRFKKKGTRIYLIVDHHESLYWWDQLEIDNALCIHIDGHHDMWPNQLPLDIEVGHRAEVDCGCYLQQAIRDSIVSKVLYIPALYRLVKEEKRDLRDQLSVQIPYKTACSITRVQSWEWFLRTRSQLPKADIITLAISPEWMPKHLWPEIEQCCEELRVHPDIIKSKKRVANRKWNNLQRYGRCKSFAFPYKQRIG